MQSLANQFYQFYFERINTIYLFSPTSSYLPGFLPRIKDRSKNFLSNRKGSIDGFVFSRERARGGGGGLSQGKQTYLTRIRTRSKLVLIPPLDFDLHFQYLRVNIPRTGETWLPLPPLLYRGAPFRRCSSLHGGVSVSDSFGFKSLSS